MNGSKGRLKKCLKNVERTPIKNHETCRDKGYLGAPDEEQMPEKIAESTTGMSFC
ncbi:MAG: hypothetical protein WCH85_07490 [Methanomicrobiales archaeon]